jgi:selenide,water dikinase
VTRLVLLGGGHAHALVLRAFRNFVSKNLDVVLVSEGPRHTYSGMVPGVIAGHYTVSDAQIDLAHLARSAGAAFVLDRVERIDTASKRVILAGGSPIEYDVASINVGSTPAGVPERATPVKPFDELFVRWRTLVASTKKSPRIAMVGAGAGGVELAMAMKYALNLGTIGGAVELFTDRFAFAPGLAARIRRALKRLSIPLHIGAGPGTEFDAIFWATGATAAPMLRASALKTDEQGFLLVDAALRSVSHPDVFAAGDAASIAGAKVPKSGVYAVRQGPVLAHNLKRVVRGMAMLDYRPQPTSLALISCGRRYAIASRGDWSAEGGWAWWWKDWIDRRWIARFR